MRKTLRASALLLALCASAAAGDIPMPPGSQPPPPSMTDGGLVTDGGIPNDEPESLTETVLSVIEGLLTLF